MLICKALVSASVRSSGGEREQERSFIPTRERERKKFRNCARAHTIMKYFWFFLLFFHFFFHFYFDIIE